MSERTNRHWPDAQAALDAMYELAKECMDNPHLLHEKPSAYFDHALGTMGYAYTVQGFTEIHREMERYRKALEEIAGLPWYDDNGGAGEIARAALGHAEEPKPEASTRVVHVRTSPRGPELQFSEDESPAETGLDTQPGEEGATAG